MTTTIRLQREIFDAAVEVAKLTRGRTDIGAVVTFSGICRADENGAPIAALTLEHYPDMAEAEIARHVEEARSRWPLLGVTVIHRFGRIAPGEVIVLVVTASSHRSRVCGGLVSDGLSQNARAVLETSREGLGRYLDREDLGRCQSCRRSSGRTLVGAAAAARGREVGH